MNKATHDAFLDILAACDFPNPLPKEEVTKTFLYRITVIINIAHKALETDPLEDGIVELGGEEA